MSVALYCLFRIFSAAGLVLFRALNYLEYDIWGEFSRSKIKLIVFPTLPNVLLKNSSSLLKFSTYNYKSTLRTCVMYVKKQTGDKLQLGLYKYKLTQTTAI